jgi:hypothetical protein
MVDYKLILTPVDTQAKVSTESGPRIADPTHFSVTPRISNPYDYVNHMFKRP